MRARLRLLFYALPLVLWMAAIFYMSGSSGSSEHSFRLLKFLLNLLAPGSAEELSYPSLHAMDYVLRKTCHVTEYAILTLLALRAVHFGRSALTYRHIGTAGGIAVLYAMSDELHQLFVSGRTGKPQDVLIDSIGVCLVLIPALLWRLHGYIDKRLQEPTTS